ncbi:metal-dependent hydrolase family protein [Nocardia arthritidis]|uniref:Amidohydrolase family protein n=1 Tax=Nocardia arthritidis TaxID=228602 RepID=A0A6G9YL03_9NOCA|nr:amidohydrolase family protein [Nocardia arthritidis]QIS13985.1 amidohydrolase family protein [Nocardia arthritidis]
MNSSKTLLIKNASVLDVRAGEYTECDILAVDGTITELGPKLSSSDPDCDILDARGKFALPGLIDCHVHVIAGTANLGDPETQSPFLTGAQATALMGQMLDRGFTTVRDCGGADYGLAQAQAVGLIRAPRLFYGGPALSQTGGHGDFRPRGDDREQPRPCCGIGRVVDGPDEARKAARDELRKGAHHIKMMGSGGVASPTDRIESTQFSVEEIDAVVAEATAAGRYVAAHVYTAAEVTRALEHGVRSIEHGDLLDETNIPLFLEHNAFLVPTLVTYWSLQREGREFGLSETSWKKVDRVLSAGAESLELAARAGVNIAFGTDLLGGMQRHQTREFAIRAEVQSPIEVVRAATLNAARLLRQEGRLGEISVGATADLILLAADPLDDIAALAAPEKYLHSVVQSGNRVVETK